VGRSIPRVRAELQKILDGGAKKGTVPPLWDGRASERIAAIVTGIS
jgi:hypothetical protein